MMRGRTWRGLAAGVCVVLAAYVLFLVVLAPAALLDVGLRHATDGRLRLAQAHGTLWSGDGLLEIRDASGHAIGKDLSWSLQPRALWRGRLDFAVAVDRAGTRFPLRLSRHGIELSDLDLSLPASAIGVAVPRMAPLGPRGEIVLHVAKFSLVDGVLAADAVATWKGAGSALTTVAPLGSYELRLGSVAGSVEATLRTLDGPLHLDGHATWRGSGPPALAATARVEPRYRPQLAPLLRLIAVERGDGDFALQLGPPLGGGMPHAHGEGP